MPRAATFGETPPDAREALGNGREIDEGEIWPTGMASHILCQTLPMWVCVESDEANKHCPLNMHLICKRSAHDKQFQITLDGPVGRS